MLSNAVLKIFLISFLFYFSYRSLIYFRLINMQSGKWFYEYLITDRKKKSIVLGSDVVRASIRRTRGLYIL